MVVFAFVYSGAVGGTEEQDKEDEEVGEDYSFISFSSSSSMKLASYCYANTQQSGYILSRLFLDQ